MATRYGMCPKCLNMKNLTRHHIYPKRFFKGSDAIICLCRLCHDKLERLIPHNRIKKRHYVEILENFLRGWK